MFLISLTYTKPLIEIDKYLSAHSEFLDKKYAAGILIFSGRKVPRTGGLFLTTLTNREAVDEMIHEDPFHEHRLANYEIIEFTPTKWDPRFAPFCPK